MTRALSLRFTLFAALVWAGCALRHDTDCQSNADCQTGRVCQDGECVGQLTTGAGAGNGNETGKGGTSGETSQTGGTAGTGSTGYASCTDCLNSACYTPFDACLNTSDSLLCELFHQCLSTCTDGACAIKCNSMYGTATANTIPLWSCAVVKCNSICYPSGLGQGGGVSQACQACEDACSGSCSCCNVCGGNCYD